MENINDDDFSITMHDVLAQHRTTLMENTNKEQRAVAVYADAECAASDAFNSVVMAYEAARLHQYGGVEPTFALLERWLDFLIDRLDSDGGPTHEDERDLLGSMVILKKRLNGDYSFRTETFPKSASASE